MRENEALPELSTKIALGVIEMFIEATQQPNTTNVNVLELDEVGENEAYMDQSRDKTRERDNSISGLFRVSDDQSRTEAKVYIILQWDDDFPDDFEQAYIRWITVEINGQRKIFGEDKFGLGLLEQFEPGIKRAMEKLLG